MRMIILQLVIYLKNNTVIDMIVLLCLIILICCSIYIYRDSIVLNGLKTWFYSRSHSKVNTTDTVNNLTDEPIIITPKVVQIEQKDPLIYDIIDIIISLLVVTLPICIVFTITKYNTNYIELFFNWYFKFKYKTLDLTSLSLNESPEVITAKYSNLEVKLKQLVEESSLLLNSQHKIINSHTELTKQLESLPPKINNTFNDLNISRKSLQESLSALKIKSYTNSERDAILNYSNKLIKIVGKVISTTSINLKIN